VRPETKSLPSGGGGYAWVFGALSSCRLVSYVVSAVGSLFSRMGGFVGVEAATGGPHALACAPSFAALSELVEFMVSFGVGSRVFLFFACPICSLELAGGRLA
jgi:hypothetical protein